MTQWGLDNLFNPGKRHMDDEKRRLQATREEVGDASGGRRIDLDSGVVAITTRPQPTSGTEPAPPAAGPDPGDPAEAVDVPDLALDGDGDLAGPQLEDEPAPALAADESAVASDEPAVASDESTVAAEEPPAAAQRPARRMSAAAWSRRG